MAEATEKTAEEIVDENNKLQRGRNAKRKDDFAAKNKRGDAQAKKDKESGDKARAVQAKAKKDKKSKAKKNA